MDHNIPSKRMKLYIRIGEMFRKENISCSIDRITKMSDKNMWCSLYCSNKYDILIEICYMMNRIERSLYDFLCWISWYKATRIRSIEFTMCYSYILEINLASLGPRFSDITT